jgi:hypothetical protein
LKTGSPQLRTGCATSSSAQYYSSDGDPFLINRDTVAHTSVRLPAKPLRRYLTKLKYEASASILSRDNLLAIRGIGGWLGRQRRKNKALDRARPED